MLTVLFVLKMATLAFKPTYKDRLFYDQYEYALTFRLTRAGFLRSKSHELLDKRIQWHNVNQFRWTKTVEEPEARNLHDFLDVLESLGSHKLLLTTDYVYIYSNSVDMLERIANLPYVNRNVRASQAVINRPRDTVLLLEPKYQYRTYFKERFMTPENMAVLSKFLLSRTDCFRITDELRRRLRTENNCYTTSYYFVDHNNMEDLVMLQIVCPGIVRKTLTIQAK